MTDKLQRTAAPSVEQSVKAQYATVFCGTDWPRFKRMADALLREAAFIKTSDMRFTTSEKLLARNSRKRLLIGVGTELLLKAIYLKSGYAINKARHDGAPIQFPFTFQSAKSVPLDGADTFTLAKLIDKINRVIELPEQQVVFRGLKIAKVFRNKEGHVVAASHTFEVANYRDIESSLALLYRQAFDEVLSVRFSLAPREAAVWRISPPDMAIQRTPARGRP